MTDDSAITAFNEKYRIERLALFRSPMLKELAEAIGHQLPIPLVELYMLGEYLLNAPLLIETSTGCIEIQSFAPLWSETITECRRYGCKYYVFAGGSFGEYLLAPLDGSDLLNIDPDGTKEDILFTPIRFSQVVEKVKELLAV